MMMVMMTMMMMRMMMVVTCIDLSNNYLICIRKKIKIKKKQNHVKFFSISISFNLD